MPRLYDYGTNPPTLVLPPNTPAASLDEALTIELAAIRTLATSLDGSNVGQIDVSRFEDPRIPIAIPFHTRMFDDDDSIYSGGSYALPSGETQVNAGRYQAIGEVILPSFSALQKVGFSLVGGFVNPGTNDVGSNPGVPGRLEGFYTRPGSYAQTELTSALREGVEFQVFWTNKTRGYVYSDLLPLTYPVRVRRGSHGHDSGIAVFERSHCYGEGMNKISDGGVVVVLMTYLAEDITEIVGTAHQGRVQGGNGILLFASELSLI